MPSKSLKSKEPQPSLPATDRFSRPPDFPLGSVRSRVAARAMVDRLAEQDGPQPGDVFVDMTFLGHARAIEVYRKVFGVCRSTETQQPRRIPGQPRIWITWPAGVIPGAPEVTT